VGSQIRTQKASCHYRCANQKEGNHTETHIQGNEIMNIFETYQPTPPSNAAEAHGWDDAEGSARTIKRARPIAIDLFSGAGGMSLGFEQAGFDVKAAVEIDPVHCATYAFNFPRTTVICAPAETLSGQDIRDRAGIGAETIDCVFGGPPSQGFTGMGKRDIADPRNALVGEFFRLVRELTPRSFIFDNVRGITFAPHSEFLHRQIARLEVMGYEVRRGFKILNAVHFGVPQSREHFFLFGVRYGEQLPHYPTLKFHAAGRRPKAFDAPVGPTVQDALGDLPDADQIALLRRGDAVEVTIWGPRSAYASHLRCESASDWHLGYPRDWDPNLLTSSTRTEHNAVSKQRFAQTPLGAIEEVSRFFKLDPANVANTLRAGTDATRGAFSSPRPIHHEYPRCITVREMARLHGFPDWFRFHTTKWHGARQVGLAVPPPLARAIATEMTEALGFKPLAPQFTLPKQNPELLGYDVTRAAKHFGVTPQLGKRSRKADPEKRNQGQTGMTLE
jgi:DNA (cytosine-5)-methyltransferase 1